MPQEDPTATATAVLPKNEPPAPADANGFDDVSMQAMAAAGQRLSQLVTGNDNLVAEPGLVQALYQGNASPQQASAINQFLGGLQAEQKVRIAAAAGTKIPLTTDEQDALNAMGVPFETVLAVPQTPLEQLTQRMAAQGLKPKLDEYGQPVTDANGNVVAEQLKAPKKRSGLSRIWHDVTHNPVTSLVMDGTLDTRGAVGNLTSGGGIAGAANDLQQTYQWVSSTVSGQLHAGLQAAENPGDAQAQIRAQTGVVSLSASDAELARRLGYDPSNLFSVQAFKAKGYAHNDTSHIADAWDKANPTGLFGWSGDQAVTEAEVFAADPEKYRQGIENDPSLTPDQVATKLAAIDSDQFKTLVRQLAGSRSDFGVDIANSLQIDPVKHPTAFQLTSTGANVLAQFFVDPLAVAGSIHRANAIASTAVSSFADGDRIRSILTAPSTTGAMSNVQGYVRQMVAAGNAFREADDAGRAAITARLDAANPFSALLPDFVGSNQIVRQMTESEYEAARQAGGAKQELSPFITGRATRSTRTRRPSTTSRRRTRCSASPVVLPLLRRRTCRGRCRRGARTS